jgi:hypothetical protein
MGARARCGGCARRGGAEAARAALLLLALAAPSALRAAEPPRVETLRFEEDWSDVDSIDPPVPPYKHMDLDPGGEIWAGLGGELRSRAQAWRHYWLTDQDDAFGEGRMRLYADLHFVDRLRLYSEVLSALAFERDLPGGDDAETDEITLQNAFLELRFAAAAHRGLRLRAGRQELAFGSERLIGPADFRNAGRRTFDGVALAWQASEVALTGFLVFPVEVRADRQNKVQDDPFIGLWLTHADAAGGLVVDVYAMGLRSADGAPLPDPYAGLAFDVHDRRYTAGSRVRLERAGAELELEGGYQWGRRHVDTPPGVDLVPGEGPISAWFATLELGRRLERFEPEPRFFVGADYASGGRSLLDPHTFDAPFPSEHRFLGDADLIGRANIVDLHGGMEFGAGPTVELGAEVHGFWRASEDEALYTPAGRIVRLPVEGARFLGVEVDLRLRWLLPGSWALALGYAHLFPGSFVEASGPDVNLDFTYAELTLTF